MDLDALTENDIREVVKNNQLSEEQAQRLIEKEQNGRGRKFVLKTLAAQARKAKRIRNLNEFQDDLTSTA